MHTILYTLMGGRLLVFFLHRVLGKNSIYIFSYIISSNINSWITLFYGVEKFNLLIRAENISNYFFGSKIVLPIFQTSVG